MLLWVASACEFEPGSIPERPMERPSDTPPGIQIALSPETDTLFVSQWADISYIIDASPQVVYYVDFYIGDRFLGQRDYQPGQVVTFRLEVSNYMSGVYDFKMNIFTSSNSGSIADKIRAEGYLYMLTWPLVVDRTPTRPLRITSVDPVTEGGVMVNWDKFTAGTFQQYKLSKQNMYSHEEGYVAIINDRFNARFQDTEYLEGEQVNYRVVLNDYPGPVFRYAEQPEPPVVTPINGFEVEVTWKPPRNLARLDYYRLFQGNMISPSNEIRIKGSDGVSSYRHKQVRFGSDLVQNLQYVPKTTETNTSFWSLENASVNFAIGEPVPVSDAIRKLNGTGYGLLSQGDRLLLYDHKLRKTLDSIDFSPERFRAFRVTQDGKYVYTLVGNTIRIYEPEGFRLVASENLTDIDPLLSTVYEMYPSDNKRLLFVTAGFRLLVYDFAERKVILKSPENAGLAVFSPSGDKILTYGLQGSPSGYYRIRDNELELIGELPESIQTSYYLFAFSPATFNHVLLFTENQVEIRNADDFSLVKRHNIPYNGVLSWDQENYRFIARSYDQPGGTVHRVIQLPDWQVISPDLYLSGSYTVLNGDFLVARNGRQMNFKDLEP
jgi:hypothetical protein